MPDVAINKAEWQAFAGDTLDSTYRLQELIGSGKGRATFRAESMADGSGAIVLLMDAGAVNPDALRKRFLEAKFLRHANLLTVQTVAGTRCHGRELLYAAMESADTTLAAQSGKAKPAASELREILLDAARALAYLHSEHLVYCALAAESVWRVGDAWKLGDYSELRLPGKTDPRETRALMTREASTPPEAFEGIVSPAWDVWSLGWMLARLSSPEGPFDAIIGGCLEPKPADRWSIDKVIQALERVNTEQVAKHVQSAPAAPVTTAPVTAAPIAAAKIAANLNEPPVDRHTAVPADMAEPPNRPTGWLRLLIFGLMGALAACVVWFIVLFVQEQRPTIPKDALKRAAPIVVQPPRQTQPASQTTTGNADRAAVSPADDIQSLLDRWVVSMRNRDVDAQMACYAPKVDQYFGWRNVSADKIRQEKQRDYAQIGEVRQFQISNVRIQHQGPNRAVVRFDKTWDYGQRSQFAGSEQAQLTLTKISGQWRITGEKEGKVYWVKRGNGKSAG